MKRKIICLLLILIFLFGTGNIPAAAEVQESDREDCEQLEKAYQSIQSYAVENGIALDMTLETFVSEYDPFVYESTGDYLKTFYEILIPAQPVETRSAKGAKWYYDTGTALPQRADYSRYRLLDVVQPGDIIHEKKGGFGITAHTAVVEGIFYDATYKQYYIRVIEAIDVGVKRGVLDDERVGDKGVSVYRVRGAGSVQKNAALNFCIGQLNKKYALDFAKDTDFNEKDWYCSELVWAGYYNQGINIETSGFPNEPGITPRDIIHSRNVSAVSFE